MIKNKKDLKHFIKLDIKNNYIDKRFSFFSQIKRYLITLRKTEYFYNTNRRFLYAIYKIKFSLLSKKLLTFIPINSFGPGLSISHFGCIYVNPAVKVGCNCRIHEMVTIGATNGSKKAAIIGDNVFIGSGAKIIGDVSIANDVAIGAGAVVVKDIEEAGTTWGGVPAVKISNNNSHSNIKIFNS